MAKEKVTARTQDKPTPVEVEYDFGDDNLKGLVTRFGEDVVYSRAKSALVIDLQALMRRHIDSKDFKGTPEDLAKLRKAAAEWKPTVSNGVRRSAAEKIEDSVAKMSPEEQKALLAKLTSQVAASKPSGGKAPAGARA